MVLDLECFIGKQIKKEAKGISLPSENGLLLGLKPELTKPILCCGQEGCFSSF